MRSGKNGFTLIELIIAIVIIGVLASIAAPMIGNLKAKAVCTEAVTMMSRVRDAIRQYYGINGSYPVPANQVSYLDLDSVYREKLGLNIDDFSGAYTGKECLGVVILPPNTATSLIVPGRAFIMCIFSGVPNGSSTAPRKQEVINLGDAVYDVVNPVLYMYISNGRVTQANFSRSGYPVFTAGSD
jgi:prepilin-type N-terminal cleavage/methylation domain-containing protein